MLRYLIIISLIYSCTNGDKTTSYLEAKKEEWVSAQPKDSTNSDLTSTPTSKSEYTFNAPKHWEVLPNNSIRIGNFKIYNEQKSNSVELTLIVLAGVGGGLIPNLNRWRQQLNLNGLTEKELLPTLKKIEAKAGEFLYTHLINEKTNQGMLVAIFTDKEKTLFVKANGVNSILINEEKNYLDFVRSIDVLR